LFKSVDIWFDRPLNFSWFSYVMDNSGSCLTLYYLTKRLEELRISSITIWLIYLYRLFAKTKELSDLSVNYSGLVSFYTMSFVIWNSSSKLILLETLTVEESSTSSSIGPEKRLVSSLSLISGVENSSYFKVSSGSLFN
jgi:hypothetical protein